MGNDHCSINTDFLKKHQVHLDYLEENQLINISNFSIPMVDNHFFSEVVNPKNDFPDLYPIGEILNFDHHCIYKAQDSSSKRYLVRFFHFQPFTKLEDRAIDFSFAINDMRLRESFSANKELKNLLFIDRGSKFEVSYNIYGIKGYTRILLTEFASCSLKQILRDRNNQKLSYEREHILYFLGEICEWLIAVHSQGFSSLCHYPDKIFWLGEEIKILNTITVPYENGRPLVDIVNIYDPLTLAIVPEAKAKVGIVDLEKIDVFLLGILALSLIDLEYDPYVYIDQEHIKRRISEISVYEKWISKLLAEMVNSNPKQRPSLSVVLKILKSIPKKIEVTSFNFDEKSFSEWKILPLEISSSEDLSKSQGRRGSLIEKFKLKHYVSMIFFYSKLGNIEKSLELIERFSKEIENATPEEVQSHGIKLLLLAPYLITHKKVFDFLQTIFNYIQIFEENTQNSQDSNEKQKDNQKINHTEVLIFKFRVLNSFHFFFNQDFEKASNLLDELDLIAHKIQPDFSDYFEKLALAFFYSGQICLAAEKGENHKIQKILQNFSNHLLKCLHTVEHQDFKFITYRVKQFLGYDEECCENLEALATYYQTFIDVNCLERFNTILLLAKSEISIGKYNLPLRKIYETLNDMKEFYGEKNSLTLPAFFDAGIASFNCGDILKATEYFEKVIEICQEESTGFNSIYQLAVLNLASINLTKFEIVQCSEKLSLLTASALNFGNKGPIKYAIDLIKSRVEFFKGNFVESRKILQSSLFEDLKSENLGNEARLLNCFIQDTLLRIKNLTETQNDISSLVKEFKENIESAALIIKPSNPMSLMLKLNFLNFYSEIGYYHECDKIISECLQHSKNYFNKENLFFRIFEIVKANLHYTKGSPSKFIKNYTLLINHMEKFKLQGNIMSAIFDHNIAIALYQDSKLPESLSKIQHSIKIFESNKLAYLKLISKGNFAAIEIHNIKFGKARKLLSECEKISKEIDINNNLWKSMFYNNNGITLFIEKKFDLCFESFEMSLELKKSILPLFHKRILNSFYNYCLLRQENYQSIVAKFIEDSEKELKHNDPGLADIYLLVFYVYLNKDNFKEGVIFAEKAGKIYLQKKELYFAKVGIIKKLIDFYTGTEKKEIIVQAEKKRSLSIEKIEKEDEEKSPILYSENQNPFSNQERSNSNREWDSSKQLNESKEIKLKI